MIRLYVLLLTNFIRSDEWNSGICAAPYPHLAHLSFSLISEVFNQCITNNVSRKYRFNLKKKKL